MYDVIIKGGTIVDGLGGKPFVGDIAFRDGKISEIGASITATATETLDAEGKIVTPGWVDVHTHYDGQVSWDTELAPSSHNGATTVVMGNCGVGFAPVRQGQEKALIELMEGVEDIPGTALYEGIEWGEWESFPEYMDYIAGREFSIDVGAQIPHGAVRYYVMGERGRTNEDATEDDIAAMSSLVAEAVDAGAVGFSTSRTIGHRALWGEAVPGTFAAEDELFGIAEAMGRTGKGVLEVIPAGTVGKLEHLGGERSTPEQEHEMMRKCSEISGRPLTFTLVPTIDYEPDLWRKILALSKVANDNGAQMYPQVPSRYIGYLTGLSSYHPFMRKPTYLEKLAHLPLDQRVEAMRDPDIKSALLTEKEIKHEAPGSMENISALLGRGAAILYPLADPVDYEAGKETNIGNLAKVEGREAIEYLYDFLLEDGGTRFCSLSTANLPKGMEVLRELLEHSESVTGLSDAGAHVTLICDATMPSTQLSYWARDRKKGEKLPLEFLVHKQTARNAALYGFSDRGSLEVGKRADINVIDFEKLSVAPPVAYQDLPAGGTRVMQPVSGYIATYCNGILIRKNDQDTGARPGRLVRSA
ncbi:N-acyl-D-amino-acid deacylase family protein [Parasphingorhabdus sp.]|jgi:N-acyl-D-aspartate/D-glutamate deacylase|uniref:N-acyl-D-amino-acid deacylase family protein n=1 Tax=Parasphingorhabdus sp. TaxID=2709688 RepID=UPI003D27719A